MNTPAAFLRFTEHWMGDFRNNCAVPYLDDRLISKAFWWASTSYSTGITTFQETRHKDQPIQMQVFQKRTLLFKTIGVCWRIYRGSWKCRINNIEIRKKPNILELRSLHGLVGYLRRSIPNFSQLVKPLYLLLNDKDLKRGSKQLIEWTLDHESIIDKLLTWLTEPSILAYPDYSTSFNLHTDVSSAGLEMAFSKNKVGNENHWIQK